MSGLNLLVVLAVCATAPLEDVMLRLAVACFAYGADAGKLLSWTSLLSSIEPEPYTSNIAHLPGAKQDDRSDESTRA